MKKSKEPCVLKEDVQDAVNFVNNVKATLKVLTVIVLIALFFWGTVNLVIYYNDSLRKEGAREFRNKAWMCQYEDVTGEQIQAIWKEFPKDSTARTIKLREVEIRAVTKCIREL